MRLFSADVSFRPGVSVFWCFIFFSDNTGEVVGRTDWTNMEQLYGSPYYHVHRADLHRMLYDLVLNCRTTPIDIKLASTVIDVGVHDNLATSAGGAAWAKLQNGQILHADLIVAADGVKSLIREVDRISSFSVVRLTYSISFVFSA